MLLHLTDLLLDLLPLSLLSPGRSNHQPVPLFQAAEHADHLSISPSPPSPELIRRAVCTSLPSDVLLDLHESFADRPVSVGILGAGQAEGVLQSVLQRGQGLLLLLQTSLVHLGLSQKLLRVLGGEAHGGGIGDVSLKTGQEAATLLYLKKAG